MSVPRKCLYDVGPSTSSRRPAVRRTPGFQPAHRAVEQLHARARRCAAAHSRSMTSRTSAAARAPSGLPPRVDATRVPSCRRRGSGGRAWRGIVKERIAGAAVAASGESVGRRCGEPVGCRGLPDLATMAMSGTEPAPQIGPENLRASRTQDPSERSSFGMTDRALVRTGPRYIPPGWPCAPVSICARGLVKLCPGKESRDAASGPVRDRRTAAARWAGGLRDRGHAGEELGGDGDAGVCDLCVAVLAFWAVGGGCSPDGERCPGRAGVDAVRGRGGRRGVGVLPGLRRGGRQRDRAGCGRASGRGFCRCWRPAAGGRGRDAGRRQLGVARLAPAARVCRCGRRGMGARRGRWRVRRRGLGSSGRGRGSITATARPA